MAVKVTECGCQADKTVVWDLILAELAAQDSAARPARRMRRWYSDDIIEGHFSSAHALALVCRHLRDFVQARLFKVVHVNGVSVDTSMYERRVLMDARSLSIYFALGASPDRAQLCSYVRSFIVRPDDFVRYLVDVVGHCTHLESLRLLNCCSSATSRLASILSNSSGNLAYLQLQSCAADAAARILTAIPHRLSRLSLRGLYCRKEQADCVIPCNSEELMLAPHDDQSCGLKFTLRYVPSYLVIEASDHGSALSALISQSETFRLITSLRLASQSTFYRHWLGGTSLNGESQVEPSDFELLIEPEELDVGDIVAADFELMERLATRGSALQRPKPCSQNSIMTTLRESRH